MSGASVGEGPRKKHQPSVVRRLRGRYRPLRRTPAGHGHSSASIRRRAIEFERPLVPRSRRQPRSRSRSTPKSSPNEKSVVSAFSAGPGRARRAIPQHDEAHLSAPPRACADVHDRCAQGDRVLYPRARACACPIIPATTSLSCTASTAATITWSLSHARTRRATITSAGTSAASMRSAPAPCICSTRATTRAGASAGTCSARTSSTTCAIPGAATANIPPTSTMSPPTATGRPATIRRRISFYAWGPNVPADFVHNYEA